MKKLFKFLGIVALVAVIVLGMITCRDPGGPIDNNDNNDNGGFVEPTKPKAPEVWYKGDATAIFQDSSADRVWAIAAGQGMYVAAGGWRLLEEAYLLEGKTNYGIAYSTDGQSWAKAEGNFRTELRAVAYGNGRFIAADVGDFAEGLPPAHVNTYEPSSTYYSTDGGKTWTGPITTGTRENGGLRSVIDIAYGNGRWLATGLDGRMVYSTNGGVSWIRIQQTLLPTGDLSAVRGAVYADGTWIVVGDRGMTAWSTDLVSWNIVTVPGIDAEGFQKIIYVDGVLHAAGSQGRLFYSNDKGRTWVRQPAHAHTFVTQDIYNIGFGNGYFVIVGAGGRIEYSEKADGTSIQIYDTLLDPIFAQAQSVYGLAYGGGLWISGARSGAIAFSNVRD
jgi:photosystem II stability/assembly factor-like uncharacterized protein